MENKYDVFPDGEPKTKRYNSDFNEILNAKPVWLIHKGTYIFYSIIILFIICIGFIKYPVSVKEQILISDKSSTETIFTGKPNEIDSFLVLNGEYVKTNTVIGIIKNNSNYKDIEKLYDHISDAELYLKTKDRSILAIGFDNLLIDDLKDSYSKFVYATKRLYGYKDIPVINNEILSQMIALFKKDSSTYKFDNQEILHSTEFKTVYNTILEYLEAEFELNYFNLKMDLRYWEQKYLIKNKKEGWVFFNQTTDTGNNICYVVTSEDRKLKGDIFLKNYNDKTFSLNDQEIKIQLFDYSTNNYGYIIGKVSDICYVPQKSGIIIEVDIPYPVKSTTDHEIPFHFELTGIAEVILRKESFLMKIFEPIMSVFSNLTQ